jgi:hypothetical protein
MGATVKGLGVVWGLATASTATFGAGALVQSANFGVEADVAEIRNSVGDVAALVFHNQRQTLSVEVIPSAATIANAQAASILPEPGTLVTITDASDTEVAGTHTGKFVCMSATKAKTNTGVNVLTFNLTQWVANDLSATIGS